MVDASEFPDLKPGDKGLKVIELQRALDVPWLLDDGDFNVATAAVVRAYRRSKGLEDGVHVDAEMWRLLGVDEYAGLE